VATFPDIGHFGSGVVGQAEHSRKYADPNEEAIYKIQIWNGKSGYSDAVYLKAGVRTTTQPAAKLRANCPLELVATTLDSGSVSLVWQYTSNVTVYKRARGSSTWISHDSGVSSAAPYPVSTGLVDNTWYEFKVSASAGNDSNIAMAQTKQIAPAAPTNPAPSGLTGSPDGTTPTTKINLTWSRVATNNDSAEIYKNGVLLTTVTPATTTTYSATGLTADTSYLFKVRNKWNTGPAYSEYTTEISVRTQALAESSQTPTDLVATDASDGYDYAASLSWINHGGTGTIKIERKLNNGSWATVTGASALASSTTSFLDETVTSGTYFNLYTYRVKNANVANYSNEDNVTIAAYDGGDPYCVVLDTLVMVVDSETGERSEIPISEIEKGMVVVTVNVITGQTNQAYVRELRDGFADYLITTIASTGEQVSSSPEHQYVSLGTRDTKPAFTLVQGSTVVRLDSLTAQFAEATTVSDVLIEELPEPVPVRTLLLGVLNHTYITNKLVSHNIKA
jgi:hypothetical protein